MTLLYRQLTRVSERGSRGRHNSRHQCIGLAEGGVGDAQPFDSYAIQGCVVQYNHSVRIQSQALEGEQGIIRLHHHVAGCVLILVGEHTAQTHDIRGYRASIYGP